MRLQTLAALCAGLGLVGLAQAAKVPLYDNFTGTQINRAKWVESEAWRFIDGNKLSMGRWIFGGTASNTGVTADTFSLNMPDTTPPKGLSALITVTDAGTIEGCAANTTPSFPRARLIAAYFNARPGGPVPGDRTGDVLTQVRVGRASNSVDAPGVLRVQGVVSSCSNADCSTSTGLYSADLGTTTVGTAVAVQINWTKASKLFRFTRDGTLVVNVTYTQIDSAGPVDPFVQVSLRNETANCTAGRAKAGIAALFDNVGVAR